MQLSELLKDIEYNLIKGNLNQEINQIDYDSRNIIEGSLFVCIKGANSDGHLYVKQAINAGAKAIVFQDDLDFIDGISYIKVNNTRLALALLSCAFFKHPSRELTVIGITGTKGKTTTSYMIQSILENANKKVGIIGTIGSMIDGKLTKTKNTTPESFELQRLMREMVDKGCQYCVMEVSSQGLMLHRVSGIDFDYCVFTNLSYDHIGPNEHKDFNHYKACKKMLFDMGKVGIFNKDDPYFNDMIHNCKCDIITYSIKEESDLKADNIRLYHENGHLGVSFKTNGLINEQFNTDIPGDFSVYNSLVAIIISHLLNIEVNYIKKALINVRVKGRVEIVPYSNDFTVIIDYAHNALSFKSLLETISQYNPHKIICVYGAGGKRDKARRIDVGEVVSSFNTFSILTADNPRGEKVIDICNDIVEGLKKKNGEYIIIEDRKDAIHYALDYAKKNDIVLCLGKGHEDYMIYDTNHVIHFSEKEIIEEYRGK